MDSSGIKLVPDTVKTRSPSLKVECGATHVDSVVILQACFFSLRKKSGLN